VSYQGFQNGVCPAHKFGGLITHYGVIEIGNILKLVRADSRFPIVYHQTADNGFCFEYLDGNWSIIGKVKNDQLGVARQRLIAASKEKGYDLFGNNCEHLARFVTEGKKTSSQMQAAGVVAGIAAICWLSKDKNG
jgi:hypothetical protein